MVRTKVGLQELGLKAGYHRTAQCLNAKSKVTSTFPSGAHPCFYKHGTYTDAQGPSFSLHWNRARHLTQCHFFFNSPPIEMKGKQNGKTWGPHSWCSRRIYGHLPTNIQLWLMIRLSVFIRSVPSILELECVCVCVHAHMHEYLVVYIELPNNPFCLYTQVSLFLTRRSSSCVCTYTCTCVCTDVCMCFCVLAYVLVNTCICVHMRVKALFLRQDSSLTWSLLRRQDWRASDWASKIFLSCGVLGFAHRPLCLQSKKAVH